MNNRSKFQDTIIASLDSRRLLYSSGEPLLANLLPRGFVYFLLTKQQLLSLYNGALPTFNNVDITSARLFLEPVKEDGSYKNFAISLKLSNGRTLLVPIERQGFDELLPIFHQKGTYVPLNKRRNEIARHWDTGSMSDHYDKSTYEHYAYLHEQIKTAIKNLIKKNNSSGFNFFGSVKTAIKKIRNKESPSIINIIDGGCGTGNFLRKIAEEMPDELSADKLAWQVNLFGFDFNENNVNSTRTKFYADENTTVINSIHCRVEEGDLTKTDEVIDRFSVVSRNAKLAGRQLMLEKDAPTILILSGSLTRLVLKDGFEALKSLQSIANSKKIDYIIGGGIGEPLISDYIAKQLGYKSIPLLPEAQRAMPGATDKPTKFFAYERMSLKEIMEIKTKKLQKRNELDLSLSAQPEKILAALLDEMNKGTLTIKQNVLVNLSFANLNNETIRLLKEFISKVPEVKLVMLHHDQTFIDRVTQDSFLNTKFSFFQPPRLVTDDIYLTGSKAFFDTLSTLEVVKQLIDTDRNRIQTFLEAIIKQLIGVMFSSSWFEDTDKFGNKIIEGRENDISGIYRSVLILLAENGIDILTPAKATNDIDIIEFVEEAIRLKDLAPSIRMSNSEPFTQFTLGEDNNQHLLQKPSILEMAKQLIDADKHEVQTSVEAMLQQLGAEILLPEAEIDILPTWRSALNLLVENGIDILTPAQATNDIDVIEFVEEVIKDKDLGKTGSLYGGSKSELFTAENKPTQQLSKEDPLQNENNNNLSKAKDV